MKILKAVRILIQSMGLVAVTQQVFALQTIPVDDGGTYQITISSRELSRVAMHGDGRISDYRGVEGTLDVRPDETSGELYILPAAGARSAVSFFVTDDAGNVYTLIATSKDIPSETVILQPKITKKVEVDGDFKNSSYVNEIKTLTKGMAQGRDIPGYAVSHERSAVPLWKEAEIFLTAEYEGDNLVGNTYALRNISGARMVLDEREFSSFGDDVKAIAIIKHELEAGEATRIIVVRGRTHD